MILRVKNPLCKNCLVGSVGPMTSFDESGLSAPLTKEQWEQFRSVPGYKDASEAQGSEPSDAGATGQEDKSDGSIAVLSSSQLNRFNRTKLFELASKRGIDVSKEDSRRTIINKIQAGSEADKPPGDSENASSGALSGTDPENEPSDATGQSDGAADKPDEGEPEAGVETESQASAE